MNHAIETDNVDLGLRLLWAAYSALGAQIGYQLRLPVAPLLELTGAPSHPLYPYGLAAAAWGAGQSGDLPTAEELCQQALAAQQRLGPDSEHRVDAAVTNTRASIAYATGAVHDAAIQLESTLETLRSIGNDASVASVLYGAATFYAMAGEPDAAKRLATEGLALARRLDVPSLITMNLAALAGALADEAPERAQALLRESIQLRASLDYENWAELTQAVLISARLGDWPLTLELAPPSIRHNHWTGNRPLLAMTFNIVARAVTPTDADSAAVLQGAARSMTPALPPSAPTTTDPTSDAMPARPPGPASFVTELRRETTALLRDALGEQRLHALRAEGEAMSTDDAVAYALSAITRAQRDADA
jgi:tetratricopeptide (TPR) repeat protein